jgi:multicomponent Na+:H+ antiporter subunit C
MGTSRRTSELVAVILANYLAAGVLFCIGLYVVLSRRNLIKIVMGLSLMESSTYLLLISLGYRAGSTAPVLVGPPGNATPAGLARGNVADPVLQNFCLTAIVIGVAVTAVFLSVAVRISQHYRTLDADQVRALRG